ncbi:hypothetical protein BH10PLA1_BH10PLA1_10620 [soil metagenome]
MKAWLTRSVFLVAWALWLGGAVTLLILVSRLFQFDRGLAVQVAPEMFLTFERYQVTLAVVTVAAAIVNRASQTKSLLFVVPPAALIATASAVFVTPRINHLRLMGQIETPAFRGLHGLSMVLYLVEVILLLIAGLIIARMSRPHKIVSPGNSPLFTEEFHEVSR